MPSLSAKDRVSLCQFTFADGRRCRSHRFGNHPRFCPDHAQKETRARAVENLGGDLDYFFSADYLSACDLATALGRLLPAVICGDVKPRAARTVAYLSQTLLQAMRMAEHEYINVFGTDGWRKSIRNSVNTNYDHRFPHAPKPAQPASPQPQSTAPTSPACHPERSEGSHPTTATQSAAPPTQPTSAEFAQHVLAGRNLSETNHPSSTTGRTPPTPATHSAPSTIPTPPPACPETTQKDTPAPAAPPTPKPEPFLDARAYHYDHTYTLHVDGKPF